MLECVSCLGTGGDSLHPWGFWKWLDVCRRERFCCWTLKPEIMYFINATNRIISLFSEAHTFFKCFCIYYILKIRKSMRNNALFVLCYLPFERNWLSTYFVFSLVNFDEHLISDLTSTMQWSDMVAEFFRMFQSKRFTKNFTCKGIN